MGLEWKERDQRITRGQDSNSTDDKEEMNSEGRASEIEWSRTAARPRS